jgi:hypothetical protein
MRSTNRTAAGAATPSGAATFHGSQSGPASRRRLEAGRTAPVRGLWSISTGFRHPFNDPFFYESESCPSSRQTGCKSRTGCHLSSPASIEVMQQTFNLLSTEHSRGGGPLFPTEVEPDERAGTVSKADRSAFAGWGACPPASANFIPAWQSSHAPAL